MSTESRPLIILNPTADRGSAAARLPAIIAWAETYRAEVALTSAPGDATRLAQDAARAGRTPIVAVGGDGTIHEVVVGILSTGCDVALGVVPAGSGNDFATATLHIPPALEDALAVALTGRVRRLDVARLNDGWMLNSFGAGIDANAAWDAVSLRNQPQMPLRGPALYTFAALRQIILHYHRLPHLEITCDDRPVSHGPTLLAAVMIGPTAGGGYRFAPDALSDDGLLDMCISRRMLRPKVLVALMLLKQGRHTGLREIRMLRGRQIRLQSAQPIQIHVDGELRTGQRFDIQIAPGALAVMAPSAGPR
jgi:diacylglycerol kinase (ATP)